MLLVKKRQVSYPFILLLSLIYTYMAISTINNPDYKSYYNLVNSFNPSTFTFNIEPVLSLLSYISIYIYDLFGVDKVVTVYFLYIALMQFFLYSGINNIVKDGFKSLLILIFYSSIYGTMHFLIQIRFGLANCLFVYLFSLLFTNSSIIKLNTIASLTFFSHYSSILAIASVYVQKVKLFILSKKAAYGYNLIFALTLIAFTKFNLFYSLPDFLLGRLFLYLQGSFESVSKFTIIISIFMYILLIFTKSINSKFDVLRIYGAASFLPYILSPNFEILVRLGIALQYLLVPYFFLTYKYKKLLITSTLPLLFFYIYKMYSNFNALLSYL